MKKTTNEPKRARKPRVAPKVPSGDGQKAEAAAPRARAATPHRAPAGKTSAGARARSGTSSRRDGGAPPTGTVSKHPPAAGAPAATARAPRRREPCYRVLMVASEAVPFAKSGGLGDVTGALPLALARLGHDVTLVIPRYGGIAVSGRPLARAAVDIGPSRIEAAVYERRLEARARVWLLDQPGLYDRPSLYGEREDYADNALRYAFLAKAALVVAAQKGLRPDVVHAHDWQAGLVPVYLETSLRHDAAYARAASVFTVHNLSYQGLFDKSWVPALGLGWDLFTLDGIEYWDRVSFLKAGLNFSTRLTTVSERYAQEIQTAVAGFGFDGIVRKRAGDLTGILNGIDLEGWNPASDPYIPRHYSVDDLAGKREAKRALLEACGIPVDRASLDRPLVGMVSRMVLQKGLDLIAAIEGELPHLGATVVVHGTGEPHFEQMWRELARAYPDRIGVKVGYEEPFAHLVQAGSDLWLMPSRFEPCGLSQMYSQRYGTLPLVRATGGLDDTVVNYDQAAGVGTGFKFDAYDPAALLGTLRWALSVYQDQAAWRRMQRRAMAADFTWERAGRAYEGVYRQAIEVARTPRTQPV